MVWVNMKLKILEKENESKSSQPNFNKRAITAQFHQCKNQLNDSGYFSVFFIICDHEDINVSQMILTELIKHNCPCHFIFQT